MPRHKCYLYRNFFKMDSDTNYNKCVIRENQKICEKIIKVSLQNFLNISSKKNLTLQGDHGSNLASHIKCVHKSTWAKIEATKKETAAPTSSNQTILFGLKHQVNISITKEELLKSCVEMCSINGRPFSVVEDSGFRKIIDPITQSLNISINRKSVKDEVIKRYNMIVKQIASEVEGKLLCLKIDGLTHSNRSFLGKYFKFF